MRVSLRNFFLGWLTAAFLLTGMSAQAGMIGTEAIVAAQTRDNSLTTVNSFMAREDVQHQLQAWGVEPVMAAERVAQLSDEELQTLAQNIDAQPAGGVLVVLGIVFVVLLVLELVGVTNIFNRI